MAETKEKYDTSLSLKTSKINMKQPIRKKNNNKISLIGVIIGIILLLGLVLTIVLVLNLVKDEKFNINKKFENINYSIMLDAGSSSTKVFIYSFPKIKDNSLLLIKQIANCKKQGGIDDTTNISSYFSDIFKNSSEIIRNHSKSDNLSEVPIFLKATGGLRKLDNNQQENVIKEIREVIKNESEFWFEDDWAKIINGEEEGNYGWISINYISGILRRNDNNAKKQIIETLGSLDMGGSSSVISFPLKKDSNNKVKLGKLSYSLFSNAIEGYGNDDAIEKLNFEIVNQTDNSKKIIEHPCFPSGYSASYKLNKSITLNGTGNWEKCEEFINEFLISPIKDKQIYDIEPSNLKFIAMNGYYYTANNIGINTKEYVAPKELYDKGKIICGKNNETLNGELPADQHQYLHTYCFYSLYYYHLLKDVYKFNETESKIHFADKINGFTLSWSLGAMAYELDLLYFK